MLAISAGVTVLAFFWPFFTGADTLAASSDVAPLLFALTLPLVAAVVAAELGANGMDSKTVAMLGVLAALGAALRPLGTGIAGVELVFFLIILGGRVFGPGFGFLLGSATLLVSALITAGVGPWLPFQMLAASWVGLGAGLLPRRQGAWELGALVVYGALASVLFGFVMNLSFWPFTLGPSTELSFIPGAGTVENLRRYLVFYAATSLAWDVGRALTTVVMLALFGPMVIRTLRRTATRGAFAAAGEFQSST